jgi:hypothetical protein
VLLKELEVPCAPFPYLLLISFATPGLADISSCAEGVVVYRVTANLHISPRGWAGLGMCSSSHEQRNVLEEPSALVELGGQW